MFQGVMTALVTPFLRGEVDFSSLERLIDQQLKSGIQGFVVCGTTAESPTLSEEEQLKILDFVCRKVNKRVPILFGSGSNCTAKTIGTSKKASEYDIDGLLVVVPYYNKPLQEGLLQHFTAVAENSPKPIVLYNVPGRTITSLSAQTIIELSQHPNIVGIKDADSNLEHFAQYKDLVAKGFSLLSGDDESCIEFCQSGGHGVISVCSHIAPDSMVNWVSRARKKDSDLKDEFSKQIPWIQSIYCAPNPIPVKAALHKKGILSTKEMRLPLTSLSSDLEASMIKVFQGYEGLL